MSQEKKRKTMRNKEGKTSGKMHRKEREEARDRERNGRETEGGPKQEEGEKKEKRRNGREKQGSQPRRWKINAKRELKDVCGSTKEGKKKSELHANV